MSVAEWTVPCSVARGLPDVQDLFDGHQVAGDYGIVVGIGGLLITGHKESGRGRGEQGGGGGREEGGEVGKRERETGCN